MWTILHHRTRLPILLLSSVAILIAVAPARSQQQIPDQAEWMPGEVIFKLRADAFTSGSYRPDLAQEGRTGLAAVDAELSLLQASSLRNVFSLEVNAEEKRAMGMDRIFLAAYAGAETVPDAVGRLAQLADIEWVHPNSIGHGTFTPNDPTYRLQWGHRNRGQAVQADGDSVGVWDADIDTNQSWDIQVGAFSVVIAILDTGLDGGHPEFSGKVMNGWDFVNGDSNAMDDHGHGTCCAGIAAARGNNGQGVAGVAWGVRILPVKVLNSMNSGTEANLASGIVYATDSGANILSMSLGGYANDQALYDAVRYAFNSDRTLFAATGNDNVNTLDYPAAWSECVAVGALSPCNERKSPTSCDGETWWGSQYGTAIDLMAPGVLIHTTDILGGAGFRPGDYMESFNGTSAATPFAAGVAALILSQVYLPRAQLLSILTDSCDDIGAPGYDTETGYGRINAYVALRRVTGAVFVGVNFGFEDGSYHFPYNTVAEGITLVPSGNAVVIKPGNYDEATPFTVNKNLRIDAIDGGVTIR